MTRPNDAAPQRPQSRFIVVLLLLTLGLAGVLAYQAHRAASSHRDVAEDTLRDYAAFAAWRFASTLKSELHWMFTTALHPLTAPEHAQATPKGLPAPEDFVLPPDKQRYFPPGFVEAYFRLDLADRGLDVRGVSLPDPVCGWMADTLVAHAAAVYCDECNVGALLGDAGDGRRVLVYTVERDERLHARSVAGFETDPAILKPVVARLVRDGHYLPPALIGDIPTDSLMSVVLTDARGAELYRSPIQYAGDFAASDTLHSAMGGMRVHVTLRPDVAESLVIGGLPKSRLPLLVGLLVLTAGLVAAALLQHRREYELARLRADFVSNVSHELRTPLAQIRMFAETLLLGRVRSREESRRSLEIIDQEARRLTHLVENVLHFSRAERGTVHLAPERVDVGSLVREVADGFAPLARARSMTLRAEAAPGLVARVDRGAMCQVLLNLLDNAAKYGPPGQEIRVAAEASNGSLRVVVEDQGPGIPAKDRARVWERFSRLERDHASAVAGTGIGLSVVRELARRHGGRAWVESAPGGGARFVVDLPRPKDEEAPADPAPPGGARAAPSGIPTERGAAAAGAEPGRSA